MEEHFEAGQGGWTAQLNGVIQASTRSAYHVSGGKITPGSSATTLTVAVDAGAANVGGTDVEWTGAELELADGGIGPSGTDTTNPRVDAIFARQDSTLGVATGDPAPYAPDTDANGNGFIPSPMEHWSPAPDSGSRIGGCILGFVLVEPAFNSADDVPTENIQQWKIGVGIEGTAFVRGDGSDNGPTTITVNDDPITITDEASGANILEYDPTTDSVTLGDADAQPTLGGPLDTARNPIDFDSSASPFVLRDTNPDVDDDTAFEVYESVMQMDRRVNFGSNPLTGTGEIQPAASTGTVLDLAETSDGTRTVWTHDDGAGGDTWSLYSAPGGGGLAPAMAVGKADTAPSFAILQDSEIVLSEGNTRVKPNGDIVIAEGGTGAIENVNTLQFTEGANLNVRETDKALVYHDGSGNSVVIADPQT